MKFLKLPVFMCALSSDELTPVLIGADGQSDTSIASRGQSTGSAKSGGGKDDLTKVRIARGESVDGRGPSTDSASKDELANDSMKGCVTGECVGQDKSARGPRPSAYHSGEDFCF